MAFPLCITLAVLALALAAGGLVSPVQAPPASLAALEFMSGCWRGPAGEGATIEEYYTRPTANVMLGMTRYIRGDRVTGFEFTSIVREDSAIVVTPRPEGQQPVPFRVTRLAQGSAVWENPGHDFPQLIAYRRIPGDTLVARIEGPGSEGTRSEEWRMTRARCDG
jgi:Domain of unknown function (DUF6265)